MIKAKKKQAQPAVLIVDDKPVNIKELSILLKENYRVLVAYKGVKALKMASGKKQPDLILLDIMMPEMDGYEVCRRLKADERTQDIPVIFMTKRNEKKEEEEWFKIGASDYISKPFKPDVVRARVRTHVNLKLTSDALEKLALIDRLTGIGNRRYYEERLRKIWKHTTRTHHLISIMMIDIDQFKAYNDNYGHGAGDECLRSLTLALQNTVQRPMDVIARYAGEEFVVILPETDIEGTSHIAANILKAVRELAIPHAFSSIADYLTVSIGHVTARPGYGQNPDELRDMADCALYMSKRSGGNQAMNADISS
ncbi:MAG: diguanylate cyclase [Desulfamplus sp.]|nr:diguanylate cyclase [Desulfamplus sp.]